jgi:stage II sporulation protein M
MHRMLTRNILLVTFVFAVAVLLGVLFSRGMAAEIMQQIRELLQPLGPANDLSPLLLLIIFINNAVKALGVVLLGIIFGLPPLLFIVLNGLIIGGVSSMIASLKGWEYTVASLAPHGIIEIPAVLLAGAVGVMVGAESLKWLSKRESQVKLQLRAGLRICVRWILPGLAIAALIEAFVTPLVIRLVEGS